MEEQLIATTLRVMTPIGLVALGGVFAWRAGIFHIGLEGLMLIGAFTSVAVSIATGSVWVGLGSAIAVNLAVSAIFWAVIIPLRANAIIAGLGLSALGLGGTSFALEVIFQTRGAVFSSASLPRPVTGILSGPGAMVSELSILVWVFPILVVACWVVLRRSRFGLQVAAAGEHPFAARSAGVNPSITQLWAMLITGVFCALGGAELALGSLSGFSENMTNGRGWIAFTAVWFGGQHPIGTAFASLFFGFADAIGFVSQLVPGLSRIPREIVLMLPYVVTIVAVWISSLRHQRTVDEGGFAEQSADVGRRSTIPGG